jgi:hypothetical protein
MKFRLECDVIGSYTKVEEFKCVCADKEYEFTPNENGFLSEIKITATAKHPERFSVTITPNNDNDSKTFHFSYDGEQVQEILNGDFQYLEGVLAWRGNINRVNWESAMLRYLPESEEEKSRIAIDLVRVEKLPNELEVTVSAKDLAQFILRRDFHGKLYTQIFSFYRQGQNYFHSGRNISAFLNFYLLLEGTYAEEGHWKNFEVRNDFLASPEFVKFTQEIIDNHLTPTARRTWFINKMLSELKDAKGNPIPKALNPEGIAWLLVSKRGSLFHFRFEKGFDQPVRDDEDYEGIAFVSYSLARLTLEYIFEEAEAVYHKIILEQRKRKELASK